MPARRRSRSSWEWIISAGAGAVLTASFLLPREKPLGDLQLCAVKAISGYPCPSCGITRSMVEIGHGDVGRALSFHPLGPALFAVLLVLVAVPILPTSTRDWLHTLSLSPRVAVAVVAVIVATWAVRLVLGMQSP